MSKEDNSTENLPEGSSTAPTALDKTYPTEPFENLCDIILAETIKSYLL